MIENTGEINLSRRLSHISLAGLPELALKKAEIALETVNNNIFIVEKSIQRQKHEHISESFAEHIEQLRSKKASLEKSIAHWQNKIKQASL